MSQRKIITIGSSYAVTLPKTWIKHNKLRKGSRLSYDVQKDQTIIYTPFRDIKHQNELALLITEHNMDSIIRGIIAGFLNGYKTIRLNSQTYLTADQQKTMREIASRFYMMIIKSDSRGITLQTIVDEENASIISIIERMHIITYSMCKDILASIQTPDKELLRGLINLEDDIDQMKFLLSRLIRMSVSNPFLAAKQSIDTLD